MVAAEVGPYVRETDAADAVASLGKALRQMGHGVTLLAPRMPGFSELPLARRLTPLVLADGTEVTVMDAQLPSGVLLTLFDAPVLFDRPGVYGEDGKDYPDNAARFGLIAQVAAALVKAKELQGQAFDVVHVHDCAAALVPVTLERSGAARLPTILTVHDVARQASLPLKDFDALGIAKELNSDDGARLAGKLNLLKLGVERADAITTVSPSYAEGFTTEDACGALAEVFARLDKPVLGILNGVDYGVANPATDPSLPHRYDAEDAGNKGRVKTAILRELELELDLERPLVVAFGPATKEHGFDLVAGALSSLLKQDLSLVVTGDGPTSVTRRFEAAEDKHRERFRWIRELPIGRERRLCAAADIVVTATRHVPCGTTQLLAQRYGAVSVVLATGGILDSVVDVDAKLTTGTGVLFDDPVSDALLAAVERALAAYRLAGWQDLRRRIMRLDLSWDRPARRYLQLYRQTIGSTA